MSYTIEEKSLVWLDCVFKADYGKKMKIIAACKSAKNAFLNFERYKAEIVKVVGEDFYDRMISAYKNIDKVIKRFSDKEIVLITFYSKNYPEQLKELSEPPLVLYCKGNVELLNNRKRLAIVGSRRTLPNILKLTQEYAERLSERFVIVSGLADGGDTSAVSGALKSGNIISVQACGFDNIYPACNKTLFDKVAKSGLVISEYPPDVKAQKYYFPVRNRLLAALSDGVLVVSGDIDSGTRYTAQCAFDLGRDVFAFPYAVGVQSGAGCNNIIKEGGKLVDNLVDITSAFGINLTEKEKITLSADEQEIVDILKLGKAHLTQLIQKTGKKSFEIQAVIIKLQIKNVVADLGGNNFCLV